MPLLQDLVPMAGEQIPEKRRNLGGAAQEVGGVVLEPVDAMGLFPPYDINLMNGLGWCRGANDDVVFPHIGFDVALESEKDGLIFRKHQKLSAALSLVGFQFARSNDRSGTNPPAKTTIGAHQNDLVIALLETNAQLFRIDSPRRAIRPHILVENMNDHGAFLVRLFTRDLPQGFQPCFALMRTG